MNWNGMLAKTKPPKETFEHLFDENASLLIDIGVDVLDGLYDGREQIETLLEKLAAFDELEITDTTFEKISKHPDGAYNVEFDIGPKSINLNFTMNDEGKISSGEIDTVGNLMSNSNFLFCSNSLRLINHYDNLFSFSKNQEIL